MWLWRYDRWWVQSVSQYRMWPPSPLSVWIPISRDILISLLRWASCYYDFFLQTGMIFDLITTLVSCCPSYRWWWCDFFDLYIFWWGMILVGVTFWGGWGCLFQWFFWFWILGTVSSCLSKQFFLNVLNVRVMVCGGEGTLYHDPVFFSCIIGGISS